jgi:hypothetical protein
MEVNGYSTYIAANQACLDALLRDRTLEIIPATINDTFTRY